MKTKKLIIGISSCLLGEKVRYDGKSKRENSLIAKLEIVATLLPICPEVEIGMPIPRERLNLVGSLDSLKMIAEESHKDWTDEMREFSKRRICQDDFKSLAGLILKSKSPSCGLHSTKVYDGETLVSEKADGLFAATVRKELPELPIIDELSLRDASHFKDFIKCVTAYAESSA